MRSVILSISWFSLAVCVAFGAMGCQSDTSGVGVSEGYKTVSRPPDQDTQTAQKLHEKALAQMKDGDLAQAELTFKQACAADVFFGPAHNNLGHLYFQQKKYYLAAWEFQYAAKLMPYRVEPKNNLGMVMEAVGKFDEAAEHYEQALELQSDNPEIIANLARLYVRDHRYDARTRELLEDVIFKDTRLQWTQWAQEVLVNIGQAE